MQWRKLGILNQSQGLSAFGGARKVIHKLHDNETAMRQWSWPVTLRHLAMDRVYARIVYLYIFFVLEDSSSTLGYMVWAGMYIKDRRKLVPEDGKAGEHSWKNYL